MNTQTTLRIQNVVFYLLFIGIIGLLGWLGKTYQTNIDMTQNQRNSLNESTQVLLKRISKPLVLTAYVPDNEVDHEKLKEVIAKYRRYKEDIKLEIVNPDIEPARAKADGVLHSGQLVVKLGERQEVVSSVDEQTMSNVLQRLSRDTPRLAVFVEGHGESSPLQEKSNGLSQLAGVLENKGFLLQPHNLLRTQSIPENTAFLVISAPIKDYLEGEVKIVSDYLKQGGNLLWLHEPGDLKGLDDIEQQLGLKMHEGTLLDANQALQDMLGIKHPAAIAVLDYGKSDLTKELSAHTLFPFATAILRDEEIKDSNWQYQPFLSTLPTSWLEFGEITGSVKFDDEADIPGPLDMGMVLSRKKPNQSEADVNKQQEQRVIVVGDSDFMQNSYIGQGSNLDLSLNIFNWLGQDDDLVSIKSKVAPGTTIELSDAGRIALAMLWIGLPIGLLLFGTVRWMRRRKR